MYCIAEETAVFAQWHNPAIVIMAKPAIVTLQSKVIAIISSQKKSEQISNIIPEKINHNLPKP